MKDLERPEFDSLDLERHIEKEENDEHLVLVKNQLFYLDREQIYEKILNQNGIKVSGAFKKQRRIIEKEPKPPVDKKAEAQRIKRKPCNIMPPTLTLHSFPKFFIRVSFFQSNFLLNF